MITIKHGQLDTFLGDQANHSTWCVKQKSRNYFIKKKKKHGNLVQKEQKNSFSFSFANFSYQPNRSYIADKHTKWTKMNLNSYSIRGKSQKPIFFLIWSIFSAKNNPRGKNKELKEPRWKFWKRKKLWWENRRVPEFLENEELRQLNRGLPCVDPW